MMTDWQKAYYKDTIYTHLDSIAERVCTFCKWKSEYKDPDDLEKAKCSTCKIFEMVEDVKEEIDEL